MLRIYKISSILIISFLFIACNGFSDKSEHKQGAKRQMPPMQVDTIVAKSADIALSFTYPAKITSDANIIVVPKVSGTIIKQFFKAGDFVKANTVLYKINPASFQASFDSAKAMLNVAIAKLDSAKMDYDRTSSLRAKNALSQQSYDNAKSAYEIAKASVASARANLESAKLALNYTDVKAPFSGVVGDSLVDVGGYATATASKLVRLTALNPIYASFAIPDSNRIYMDTNLLNGNWKQINAKATLHVGNTDINGTVSFIDKVVDSGSVIAKAKFDNAKNDILPGSFATITMHGFMQKNGFLVPKIALIQGKISTQVYLLKNGKVVPQTVEISYETPTEAVISSGLKNGDIIIMDNFKKIYPGSSVVAVKK